MPRAMIPRSLLSGRATLASQGVGMGLLALLLLSGGCAPAEPSAESLATQSPVSADRPPDTKESGDLTSPTVAPSPGQPDAPAGGAIAANLDLPGEGFATLEHRLEIEQLRLSALRSSHLAVRWAQEVTPRRVAQAHRNIQQAREQLASNRPLAADAREALEQTVAENQAYLDQQVAAAEMAAGIANVARVIAESEATIQALEQAIRERGASPPLAREVEMETLRQRQGAIASARFLAESDRQTLSQLLPTLTSEADEARRQLDAHQGIDPAKRAALEKERAESEAKLAEFQQGLAEVTRQLKQLEQREAETRQQLKSLNASEAASP